jgi:Mn-containing catalase
MFHHIKELQFNARVSRPDPKFARLLLQQFGGPNGELKAAMQYFIQAFPCRKTHPDKYDLLMDIATEEFSHLEIVGATIQMLLTGVAGKLKEEADESELMQILDGKSKREDLVHDAFIHPHFYVESGGGPMLTDSMGNPWSGNFINANGDLTVDMRSNMGAESRAKIVYEYLMQFTDDPYVKESLSFLMTREIAHYQMFEAALATIEPNFPPGILQGDPRFSNTYFNMSRGDDFKGPWNEGQTTQLGETLRNIDDPAAHVHATEGLTQETISGTDRTPEIVQELAAELSAQRSAEIKAANPPGPMQWSDYGTERTTTAEPSAGE